MIGQSGWEKINLTEILNISLLYSFCYFLGDFIFHEVYTGFANETKHTVTVLIAVQPRIVLVPRFLKDTGLPSTLFYRGLKWSLDY